MRKMKSRIEARPRPHDGAARMLARLALAPALLAAQLAGLQVAGAQDLGTLDPQPLPPLAKPDDPNNPAKELFGRKTAPALLKSEVVGFYAKGCLAGAQALQANLAWRGEEDHQIESGNDRVAPACERPA